MLVKSVSKTVQKAMLSKWAKMASSTNECPPPPQQTNI